MASGSIYDITWNGSMLVAIETNGVLTSSDGLAWIYTPRDISIVQGTRVSAHNGTFYINGLDANTSQSLVQSSVNGTTWVDEAQIPTGIIESDGYRLFSFGDSIHTSIDAVNWETIVTIMPSDYTAVSDVAYGNGVFCYITSYNTIDDSVYYSSDGLSWTKGNTPATSGLLDMTIIDFVNNEFLIMGVADYVDGVTLSVTSGSVALTSSDCQNWTISPVTDFSWTYTKVVKSSGVYVAVGRAPASGDVYDRSVLSFSTDGVSWTSLPNNTFGLNDVAWGNGVFVAVGQNGVILSSTDGVTWKGGRLYGMPDANTNYQTYVGGPTPYPLQPIEIMGDISRIAWINDRFAALSGTRVLTSFNGVDWHDEPVYSAIPFELQYNYALGDTLALRAFEFGLLSHGVDEIPPPPTFNTPISNGTSDTSSSGGGGGSISLLFLLIGVCLISLEHRRRLVFMSIS